MNPSFVEWMMGLPAGWVTDCGVSRTQALKILGNGVVPQQALLALQLLLPQRERDHPRFSSL
jgi:DNA (cytosine-5)-methyltransferase 1